MKRKQSEKHNDLIHPLNEGGEKKIKIHHHQNNVIFNSLPDDVCFSIMEFLPFQQVIHKCFLINKQWNTVGKERHLFKISKVLDVDYFFDPDYPLSYFKNMIELDFVSCLFSKEYLKVISREMKQLKTLKIYSSFLGEEGAKEISTITSLQNLHLFSTSIGDKGVVHVCSMTQLVELSIPCNRITFIGAELIGNALQNLTFLNVGRNVIENQGAKFISNLKNLKELIANSIGISCDGVEFIASMKSLTSLQLQKNDIAGSIPIIGGMKQLTSLNLSDNAYVINQEDIIGLNTLPNLTELVLDDMSFGCGIFGSIDQLNRLKTLSMENNFFRGLQQTINIPELTSLKLASCQIDCIAIDSLCSLSSLTSLDIQSNHITDIGLKLISNLMRQLTLLNVCINNLTDNGLTDIHYLKDLSCLCIGGNNITDFGVKTIGKLQTLKKLEISFCNFGPEMLKLLTHLELVDLRVKREVSGEVSAFDEIQYCFKVE